ncbi:helix-turn-helix domain-containing protein [Flavivirga spongiicola]|uniref:Helix-turn-helix domain-containing protein n=1 Tax=Flavivirga spongiicola TaxID=421621 RepID=A0ABU7XYY1_9FLAO|nr:helix-turn-helix domain-containing protein [Flavivirga sp. MEBiC05379]MDO5980997.1 helix-turn-helix domain-containing protein [Flavivirga sp. MEBiC05379]
MGILILVLSLIMFEGWLNYTGYIFKTLWLTNFSEPLNFVIAPLIYLFKMSQLGNKRSKKDGFHFIPFVLWFGYCLLFFFQEDVFKYNDSIGVMNLDIPYIETAKVYTGDPLGIRNYVNLATIIHILIYITVVMYHLIKSAKKRGESIFMTTDKTLKSLRNSFYHFLIITLILIFVKITFKSDVGDYLIFLYICFMIFLTGFQMMNTSLYYTEVSSFLEGPVLKYKKSSLLEDQKDVILKRVMNQMTHEKFYVSSSASLSDLSKAIKESSHHVSQVINERLNQTFFELLATYRIDEAKAILKTDLGKKLTIEEVAESVGYNSKSAFNSAFKKITSQTPSQFRDL